MSCARCEDLCRQVPIRTPGELEKVALVVNANLDDGTIVEITSGEEKRNGPLADIIRTEFRCTECGQVFLIRCEGYHGSGGSWSHTSLDEGADGHASPPSRVSMTDYRAMTVNERLFVAGLLGAFDTAARDRDKSKMIEILLRVQLSPDQAEESATAILNDPAKYGLQ